MFELVVHGQCLDSIIEIRSAQAMPECRKKDICRRAEWYCTKDVRKVGFAGFSQSYCNS